jgi:hypothetical protein
LASSGFFDNAFCLFFYSPERRYSTADRYSRRLVTHITHITHTNLKARLLETQSCCCCLWWWEGKGQAWRQGSRRERESGSSVSQLDTEKERETERESKEADQEMSARKGGKKKDRVTATETTKPNKSKKHQKQQNQVLACYFFRQLASCIHPLLPPPRWYQRTPSCSSCCFPRTKTHTHTLSLSLSLSLNSSLQPLGPLKNISINPRLLYSGVLRKVSWLGGPEQPVST